MYRKTPLYNIYYRKWILLDGEAKKKKREWDLTSSSERHTQTHTHIYIYNCMCVQCLDYNAIQVNGYSCVRFFGLALPKRNNTVCTHDNDTVNTYNPVSVCAFIPRSIVKHSYFLVCVPVVVSSASSRRRRRNIIAVGYISARRVWQVTRYNLYLHGLYASLFSLCHRGLRKFIKIK